MIIFVLGSIVSPRYVTGQSDYQIMQYVAQWPPTVCIVENCVLEKITNKFSLHGLWPANAAGRSLNESTEDYSSARQKINDLMNAHPKLKTNLTIVWPNLLGRDDARDKNFWAGQWSKHGSCSESTVSLLDYFSRAANVIRDGEIYRHLRAAGITASNHTTIKRTDIITVLYPLVGHKKNVYIRCSNNGTHALLKEIIFCLDKTVTTFTSCPMTGGCNNFGRPPRNELQKTTVSSMVPNVWTMFDDIKFETCSSRCFFASCLPTFAIASFSGGNSSSSCTALLYLTARFNIS